jgi:hypothetical protein
MLKQLSEAQRDDKKNQIEAINLLRTLSEIILES